MNRRFLNFINVLLQFFQIIVWTFLFKLDLEIVNLGQGHGQVLSEKKLLTDDIQRMTTDANLYQ